MAVGQWRDWWGYWKLWWQQFLIYRRLHNDYARIGVMPPETAGFWMDEARGLFSLNQKEVETVGSGPYQREFSD
jgi:hypothetical protein